MDNVITEKNILKEFLKSGFMENSTLYPTPKGFSLGSPISLTLVNLTLNGLQDCLDKDFLSIRYADDFAMLGGIQRRIKKVNSTKN